MSPAPIVAALDSIDLDIAPAALYMILGRNGSGKTTLLRLIAGVLLPDAGTVTTRAVSAVHITANERQFQDRLSGYENLRFFARIAGHGVEEIRPACARVGLSAEMTDQPVWSYTTGMRLRLASARAFIGRHDLVIMDEPFRSLDIAGRQELALALKSLRDEHGAAIVIASHDLDAHVAFDRAIVLAAGKVAFIGAASDTEGLKKMLLGAGAAS